MPRFVQFLTEDDPPILVEISEPDEPQTGPSLGGPRDQARTAIVKASESFQQALSVVRSNVDAFTKVMHTLESPPDETEITFGLKAVGEIGNVAVAKVGAEASYTIKLTWKKAS